MDLRTIDAEPFELFGRQIIPIPISHGNTPVLGYRVGNAAYLTDHNDISEEAKAKLRNLDVPISDALRHRSASHPFNRRARVGMGPGACSAPRLLRPTHMSHDLDDDAATNATLPANAQSSYDGLVLDVATDDVASEMDTVDPV